MINDVSPVGFGRIKVERATMWKDIISRDRERAAARRPVFRKGGNAGSPACIEGYLLGLKAVFTLWAVGFLFE